MFYIRPIARDDLPALLALSERSGAGLTTLPANAERLEQRIERSFAAFAGNASKADACYVFVLVAGPDVVRIAPSLVISLDEILEGLARLETALGKALS